MDVALTQSIVSTATAMASAKASDAVNMTVLKKAMDMQETSAAILLEGVQATAPQPQLANSGPLGTLVNTFA